MSVQMSVQMTVQMTVQMRITMFLDGLLESPPKEGDYTVFLICFVCVCVYVLCVFCFSACIDYNQAVDT